MDFSALYFSRGVPKEENLSLYTIFSGRSWKRLISLLIDRLYIIQTNRQLQSCELTYVFIITRRLSESIKEDIRARAFNLWLTFLHRLLIRLLKFSWSSKITPKSFSCGLLSILILLIFLLNLLLLTTLLIRQTLVLTKKWHLPALDFIPLFWSHVKRLTEHCWSFTIARFVFDDVA